MTIATRGSALARWQAEHVAALLRSAGADVADELVIVETRADQRLDIPIWEMGGKGVFVKEVQAALLGGRARVAVHSAKDLPSVPVPGLVLGAVPARADARDVLVGSTLGGLAPGATIATGSVRRRAQLAYHRPDLTFAGLRGNIATRLDKIPPGGALVMAAAAIERLGLFRDLVQNAITSEVLSPLVMLPQVGQGALAVECRDDDDEARDALARIEDAPSRRAVDAERAFLAELGGDCDLPAGAYATVDADGTIAVEAMLASLDGHVVVRDRAQGTDAAALGRGVARALLDNGGTALLAG
ncbi:MAG: hydroxymethylbilane synthase [Actinobacteria bacterium]|nr:hydroxymethylbilane synthase [Actinomycetota bacterium]